MALSSPLARCAPTTGGDADGAAGADADVGVGVATEADTANISRLFIRLRRLEKKRKSINAKT